MEEIAAVTDSIETVLEKLEKKVFVLEAYAGENGGDKIE